ncbi:MAG TPA: type III pantothenate kinase [Nocardioidaceae bacterium]|nr:type III pantothenate kinase [Nocardioidaceae bacterium]
MLVTVAVQNARTAVGVHHGGDLQSCWRLATEPRRTADEWSHLIASLVAGVCSPKDVTGFAVCSAVPTVLHELRHVGPAAFPNAEVVVVGPGVRSGLPVLTDNPREVGTDRIANVVGALDVFAPPLVVVDFGTATTFDVVNAEGQYIGGAIAAGVDLSLEALARRAAQLRQVELSEPRSAIAKNTVEALQSGLVYGFAGQVDALVSRIRDELRADADADDVTVISTGSEADVVRSCCTSLAEHRPWLALEGLRVIHERNVSRPAN